MWDDPQEPCHMLCQVIEKHFTMKDIHFLDNDGVQCSDLLAEPIVLSAPGLHVTMVSPHEEHLQAILPQHAAVIHAKI